MTRVTFIPGDGIGPEVTAAARAVVDASGARIEWDEVSAGMGTLEREGSSVPERVFESIAATGVALKGPMGNTFGGEYRFTRKVKRADGREEVHSYPGPTIMLRGELQLFVNVRPARTWPGIKSRYSGVDLVIFRENSEDLYTGDERMVDADTAEATKRITRGASERVARFAADYMRRTGRKRVTIGHKSNVLKLTDGLFLEACRNVFSGAEGIEVDSRVVDALCMELVIKPETFDCIVLPNLYGDMLSDLTAGLVGGLGIAPGANMGADCAMFEAVHGSAPDIAGKDLANPTSIVLSAAMMLRYVGETDAADRVEAAVGKVLRDGSRVTRDLGGTSGTRDMGRAIVDALGSA